MVQRIGDRRGGSTGWKHRPLKTAENYDRCDGMAFVRVGQMRPAQEGMQPWGYQTIARCDGEHPHFEVECESPAGTTIYHECTERGWHGDIGELCPGSYPFWNNGKLLRTAAAVLADPRSEEGNWKPTPPPAPPSQPTRLPAGPQTQQALTALVSTADRRDASRRITDKELDDDIPF